MTKVTKKEIAFSSYCEGKQEGIKSERERISAWMETWDKKFAEWDASTIWVIYKELKQQISEEKAK